MTEQLTRKDFLRMSGGTLVGASALPFLAACGGGGDGGEAGGGATLTLAHDKVTWNDWFKQLGQASSQRIDVGWKTSPYADTNSYQAAIRTAGGTPKVPDLYTWWSDWLMKEIVDAGFAADVGELWDKHADAYSDDVRKAFTFEGKTYGAPVYLSYWVTFYSTKLFAEHDLEPPATWSEFTETLDVLRDAGVTPLAATIDGRWPAFIYFEEFLVRRNPELYTRLMAGEAKYTDPGIAEAMELWGRLIEQGNFSNPASVTLGTGSNNFLNFFKQGKVAMVQIGSWYEPTLTGAGLKPGEDFDAFVWPGIEEGGGDVVIFESGPLVVAEASRDREHALKTLDWFMSKEGQEKWIEITGFIPPRSDIEAPSPVDQRLLKTLQDGNYALLNRFWEATPHEIVEVAIDQFAKFMLKPGDPMPILEAVQQQADKTWSSIR